MKSYIKSSFLIVLVMAFITISMGSAYAENAKPNSTNQNIFERVPFKYKPTKAVNNNTYEINLSGFKHKNTGPATPCASNQAFEGYIVIYDAHGNVVAVIPICNPLMVQNHSSLKYILQYNAYNYISNNNDTIDS